MFLGFRNFVLTKADAFSAISAEIASEWTSSGIPSGRIHLIPNSVDTARFTPPGPGQKLLLREQLDLPREAVIAIYTGRLVSYKGLPLLLRVWNEIRIKHPNVMLILAGTGGLDIHNCEAELRDYVKANHMGQHVRFTGAVQNVADYLQASDLFVFPTENDAFPSSIVEAMACGLAVISTPVGAIDTIITHGTNGILIEPKNHKQLFEALDVMISDTAHYSPMGLAAVQTVRDRYSAERTNENYVALFQSIINQQESTSL
jgi:glycosyltransferase involved in cell wall biosynthesis